MQEEIRQMVTDILHQYTNNEGGTDAAIQVDNYKEYVNISLRYAIVPEDDNKNYEIIQRISDEVKKRYNAIKILFHEEYCEILIA